VYRAIACGETQTRYDELALYDIDSSRLDRIDAVLKGIEVSVGASVRHRATTRLEEAVEGADVVYCAIRVGGLEGRLVDEAVPIEQGAIGQETAGAGGIAFALRTVPVITEIARVVQRCAPGALFINFTNPVGLVTEALRPILGDQVVGICDAPEDLCARVARALGRDAAELSFDYFGLNHLGWVQRVLDRGRDLLPALLADDERLASIEEGRLFGTDWIRAVGMVPNEYLYYFYFQDKALDAMRGGNVRAAYLREQQDRFYATDAGPADSFALWKQMLEDRESRYMSEAWDGREAERLAVVEGRLPGGYGGLALSLVDALMGSGTTVRILNVANRSSLPFMDPDAIVEVPCTVGSGGIRPIAIGGVPPEAAGLMLQVRAAERTAIAAAQSRSRSLALKALAMHPLVPSVDVAERILAGYLARNAILAETLR
jgi:6-phospho-beta-glucosidase